MVDLKELFDIIEHLPEPYQQQIYQTAKSFDDYWQRRQQFLALSPEERIAWITNGLQAFREGLSDAELDEITKAMNQDYIPQPKDDPFDWIDELPEDER
jgi:hypothetical protein